MILGSMLVWQGLATAAGIRATAMSAGVPAATLAWIVPHGLAEDPNPGDTSRVAAAWVDYRVPPDALVLSDQVLNNAVYYYSGHRRFPATFYVPRVRGADYVALKQGAYAAGNWEDWFVVLHRYEVDGFRSAYPELSLEEVHTGPEWVLYRVTDVKGPG
jgi:hypothetical protein